MKSAPWLTCLIAALVFFGCARYAHPVKPETAMRGDLEECQRSVREYEKATTGSDDPWWEQQRINDCMSRKGWQRKYFWQP
jgi:hypothetical protein